MSAAGRLMTWKEFQVAIENGRGTAIGELLSTQGPFRLWWTAENILAVSPHKYDRDHHFAWPDPELVPFFEWCHAQFANPQSGRARLDCVPEEERKRLKEKLSGIQFVSTCFFPALREKDSQEISPNPPRGQLCRTVRRIRGTRVRDGIRLAETCGR
jgi:hypothetical protein